MATRRANGPYIPRADGKLRDWMNNFAAVIARDADVFGVSPEDAAKLIELAGRYDVAYARRHAPDTRGPAATAHKNAVRREVWDTVRPLAMRIKNNPAIADTLKWTLGIYPPHTEQSRIPRPRSKPSLVVLSMDPGVHHLRYQDTQHPARSAKPYGVVALQVAVLVGRGAATSPKGTHRIETVTRHTFDVSFPAEQRGLTATYFGRWETRTGLMGPWSRAEVMTIV